MSTTQTYMEGTGRSLRKKAKCAGSVVPRGLVKTPVYPCTSEAPKPLLPREAVGDWLLRLRPPYWVTVSRHESSPWAGFLRQETKQLSVLLAEGRDNNPVRKGPVEGGRGPTPSAQPR